MSDDDPCSYERGYELGFERGKELGYLEGRLAERQEPEHKTGEFTEQATREVAYRFGLVVGQEARVFYDKGNVIGAVAT